jgi:hemerythrin-like domain-containing protein
MMPIGPLMIEHRLIEKMIEIIRVRAADPAPDPLFIDAAVDFIRTYADRTHHGKEEDILFRELAKRPLNPEDKRVMDELVAEHAFARKTVAELVAAKEKFLAEDAQAAGTIREKLDALVALYPGHIRKEDKVFFPASMRYLDESEQAAMLEEMWTFDRKMIHEKYKQVVAKLLK